MAATIADVYFLKTKTSYHDKIITGKGIQSFCEHMAKYDIASVTSGLSSLKSTE